MAEFTSVGHGVVVGGPPSDGELQRLVHDGVTKVVDLRGEDELARDASPEAERVLLANARYVSIPVTFGTLGDDKVEAVARELEERTGDVLVHCGAGLRAVTMVLAARARADGLSGDESVARAHALGFDFEDKERLEDFLRDYADRHPKAADED